MKHPSARPLLASSSKYRLRSIGTMLLAGLMFGLWATEASGQSSSKWPAVGKLFQRDKSAAEVEQPGPKRNSPAHLTVIDRGTAQRIAAQPPPRSGMPPRPQSGDLGPSPLERPPRPQRQPLNEGFHDSRRQAQDPNAQPKVAQASFQQPDSRTYQNPRPTPYAEDLHPGYGGSQTQSDRVDRDIYKRNRAYFNALDSQSWNPADETYGQNSPEHPGNYRADTLQASQEAGQAGQNSAQRGIDFPPVQQPYDARRSPSVAPFSDGFNDVGVMNAGRGYLQQGSFLRGERLQDYPMSATDRALILLQENEQLRHALSRMENETRGLKQELTTAQANFDRQEEELRVVTDRIAQLRQQVEQLSQERLLAIQERMALERQFNEQLQGIETMLDGVLLKELSDKDQ